MSELQRPRFPSGAVWTALSMVLADLLVLSVVGVPDAKAALVAITAALAVIVVVLTWLLVEARRRLGRHEEALIGWAAERSVTRERLHIATDLHDLASHGLGTITLRAASTRNLAGPGADEERAAALLDIEQTSREATTELRRMLTLLRDGHTPAPLRPQPGLAGLSAVVQRAKSQGVETTLDVRVDPDRW